MCMQHSSLVLNCLVLQALQMRLPPGAPPGEHDAVAFREWREGVQVSGYCCERGVCHKSRPW